jgi:beta-lactamase regulating signal transducer with metallopeptidase domain
MNSLLGLAGDVGRHLLAWLATMNEWTFGLFFGALLLDHILARRVRASWRVALYAPLLVRVLVPRSLSLSAAHAPRVMTLLTPVPIDLPPPPLTSHVAAALGWPHAVVAVYLAGAFLLVYGILRRRTILRDVIVASRPVSGELRKLPLPCPLVEHPDAGPMVVGLAAPTIVLPSQLLATGDAFALDSVLRHECAHIARRDAWLSAGMQLALTLFWPLLPLWAASWRVRQLMEIACDEGALVRADANERRHYGRALLDLAEWRSVALTPMAAELHFGSTLRARIEALAWTKRWPLAVQVALVASALAAFGACSSVAPGPAGSDVSAGPSPASPSDWTPPAANEPLWSTSNDKHGAPVVSLEKYCGPLVARFRQNRGAGSWKDAWMSAPTDGMPAEQVAFCRSARGLALAEMDLWAAEARNALGQIGKDTVAAFQARREHGDATLCPSSPPIPKVLQAPNAKYVPRWPEDWNDGAGFECLKFGMDQPFWFQYRMDNDPTHFAATAHARRLLDGQLVDVTMVLRGEVKGSDVEVAPYLEETWKVVSEHP